MIRHSNFRGFVIRHSPRGVTALLTLALAAPALAQDALWPMWGRTPARNMESPAKGLPDDFEPGRLQGGSDDVDMATTRGVRWVAKLGSQAYGNPTVVNGKVLVGTNNESPRDPRHKGDLGIVLCLDEATGQFVWQLPVPKLGSGKVNDWEFLGICSSPHIEGERVYVVTNRCEVVCLDLNGMANGNDGEFKEEAQYFAGQGKPPIEPGPTDADILWRFDMREETGVFPHNITSSSVLILGDRLYATTSNGQDWSHVNIPFPKAPCLVCLDKNTGALLGEEAWGVGRRLFHANWSSPAAATINGKDQVIWGAGDGFVYGINPEPKPGPEGLDVLEPIWQFDCNPPELKADKNGQPYKYPHPQGFSEVIATPVVYNNRVYVGVGQDPEHGEGVGAFSCIDATGTGDVTQSGKVWQYTGINRSISTASIADGLVYIADYSGLVHCLDAETGQLYWKHDTKGHIWGSTLVADGKVYIGNEDGYLTILAAGKEHKLIREIEFPAAIYSSPVVANGVLYIGTQSHLYAIEGK